MDRRTVLAVVLSLTIYYTWMMIRGPQPDELDAPIDAPVPAKVVPVPVPDAPAPTDAPVRSLDYATCGITSKLSTDPAQ